MTKVYEAEVIRKRLNTPMSKRVIFSLMVKRADMERWKQEQGKNNTLALFLQKGMMNEAVRFEIWWQLAEKDLLTLDLINF